MSAERYGRTWEIRLPWSVPPASANDRDHWRVKARKVATIRQSAKYIVQDAMSAFPFPMPATPKRIAVDLTYVPRDKRRRDPDNLVVPLFKALCDGIVDAGIVPDDTPAYMVRSMPVIAAPDGDPRLLLTIREIL